MARFLLLVIGWLLPPLLKADQWIIWNTQNSQLPTDTITAVCESVTGVVWVGTPRGLLRYAAQLWTRFTPSNSALPDSVITALAIDAQGRLWVGTRSGVAMLDQSHWYQYTTQNSGLGNDKIRAIAAAPDGSVWFATAGGVFRWYLQQWTGYTTQNSGIPSNNIQAITIAPSGDVWIGTENAGVAVLHQQQWKRYAMDNSPLPSNIVLALYAATDAIWIATWGNGLVKLSLPDSSWSFYTTATSPLPHDWIKTITADPCGAVWIGTRAGGLAMTDGFGWESWQPTNSPLPDFFVRSLCTPAADRIWIGTNRGLVLFQPSAALMLTIDSTIIDCHNPVLQGTLTTRGQFASNNQFVFILEQPTRSDTLHRLTAHCSVSFLFPLADLLENPFFFLRVLATDPAVGTLSDTLRNTMPLPTIEGDSAFCQGDTIWLRVREPFARYQWSTGDTTAAIPITDGGTYAVTVTDSSGCSTTRRFTVTAYPRPQIRASADTSICQGEPAFLSVTGGTQYLWEPTESLNDPTSPTPIAFPTETTTYIVRGINEYGCANTDTVIVTVRPSPPPPQITQRGDTLIASAADSYQWYRNNTPIAGATQQRYVVTQNGRYKVRITDSTGCSAFSEEVEVIVNSVLLSQPSLPFTAAIRNFTLRLSAVPPPFTVHLHTLNGQRFLQATSLTPDFHQRLPLTTPGPVILMIQTAHRWYRCLLFAQ